MLTTSRWEAPGPTTRIVHFDSDPMMIGVNYRTEVGVVGDLKLALDLLNSDLDSRDDLPSYGAEKMIADIKARKFARFSVIATQNQSPIRPEQVIDTLNRLLPDTATVVSDPGTSCPYYNTYSQQNPPVATISPIVPMAR